MQAAARGNGSSIRYKSSFDAYKTISRTEGIKGLWKGIHSVMSHNLLSNRPQLLVIY